DIDAFASDGNPALDEGPLAPSGVDRDVDAVVDLLRLGKTQSGHSRNRIPLRSERLRRIVAADIRPRDRAKTRFVRGGDADLVDRRRRGRREILQHGRVAPLRVKVADGHADAGNQLLLQLDGRLVVEFAVAPSLAGRRVVADDWQRAAEARVVEGTAFT